MSELLYVKLRAHTDCEIISTFMKRYVLKILDIRPGSNGSIKHLAVIPLQYLRSEVIAFPYTRFKVLKTSGKSCVVNIEKKPCTACKVLINAGTFMVSGVAEKEGWVLYTFLVDQSTYNKLLKELRNEGINFKVVKASKVRFRSDVLTETQGKLLFIALESGLFDYPRKITLKELAKRLNISASTADEILRRALKKVLMEYFRSSQKFSG